MFSILENARKWLSTRLLALFTPEKMLFGTLVSTVSECFGAVYGQKTLSKKRLHAENMWSNRGRAFMRCDSVVIVTLREDEVKSKIESL